MIRLQENAVNTSQVIKRVDSTLRDNCSRCWQYIVVRQWSDFIKALNEVLQRVFFECN